VEPLATHHSPLATPVRCATSSASLQRIRNTLLFLGLMVLSFILLANGNAHHRARAINSSNALVGTIYTWRKEITDYANLKEVNRGWPKRTPIGATVTPAPIRRWRTSS
jgi:hypothetical protein